MWTEKLSVVSLTQVTKNKNILKEETKTNKRQCPESPVQLQDP